MCVVIYGIMLQRVFYEQLNHNSMHLMTISIKGDGQDCIHHTGYQHVESGHNWFWELGYTWA